jgi:DNA-directed RNA polymerase beta subunit
VPVEDMPYMADGTPVDVVLESVRRAVADERRPDLEAHLGWAAKGIGRRIGRHAQAPDVKAPEAAQVLDSIYSASGKQVKMFRRLSDAEILDMSETTCAAVCPLQRRSLTVQREEEIADHAGHRPIPIRWLATKLTASKTQVLL